MRCEWKFLYEARGFRIPYELRFDITVDEPVRLKSLKVESIEAFVRIVPSDDSRNPPEVDQTGEVVVLLPYTPEETYDFARFAAQEVAVNIRFSQGGDFRLVTALEMCERVPENEAEEIAIGNTPHWVMARLEEVGDVPSYRSIIGQKSVSNETTRALMSQFNAARLDKNPVSQFLGYFRVLESVFGPKKRGQELKPTFTNSESFRLDHAKCGDQLDFASDVGRLVDIRHQCAHLKLDKGFGFTPADPETWEKVVPEIPLVEALAWHAINRVRETQT
jgi:hypothetical protein